MGARTVSDRPTITFNPFLPEVRANPYPQYRRLRETDPVHLNLHTGIWFLTRYENCAFVLRDSRFSAELGQDRRRRATALPRTMLNTDPPDHARLRRPASAAFHADALERLRPMLIDFADSLLDRIDERAELDIQSEFAVPIVLKALSEILGVTAQDTAWFERMARAAAANLDPLAPSNIARRGSAATDSLRDYFEGVLQNASSQPRQLFGPLCAALTSSAITGDELIATLVLFVVGGYEPTVHLIGNGMLALLRHPDQLKRLYENPSLIRKAVDELLRYDSPIQMAMRVAREEVRFGPKIIRAGAGVIVLLGAANRDPQRFQDPDQLDLCRAPLAQLAFGAGPHVCLGAGLARLAGEVAIATLVRRYPALALANHRPNWLESLVPRGLRTLTVRLRP
jgi:cytochrome P450